MLHAGAVVSVSQKRYHQTINDNFNSSFPISVSFGTNIIE